MEFSNSFLKKIVPTFFKVGVSVTNTKYLGIWVFSALFGQTQIFGFSPKLFGCKKLYAKFDEQSTFLQHTTYLY